MWNSDRDWRFPSGIFLADAGSNHLIEAFVLSAREELHKAILRYLCESPDAKDTLEGIARFWIPRQDTALLVEGVALALQELVQRGYVVVRTTEGRTELRERFFELNKRRLPDIIEMLEESRQSPRKSAKL